MIEALEQRFTHTVLGGTGHRVTLPLVPSKTPGALRITEDALALAWPKRIRVLLDVNVWLALALSGSRAIRACSEPKRSRCRMNGRATTP